MADIRVDPPSLREAAAKLSDAADRTRKLAEDAAESAASAPSYDGQFGSQVQSMGAEAHAQMTAVATKLTALSDALLIKAEEFEAADRETEGGLAGLFAQFRSWLDSLGRPLASEATSPWVLLSPNFEWLLQDDRPDDAGEPWYKQLAIELSKAWNWYHQTVNRPIYDSLETWRGIGDNGQKIALYYLAQAWFAYDKTVNQPIYDSAETWRGNLDNARTIVLYGLARLWFGYDTLVNRPIRESLDTWKSNIEMAELIWNSKINAIQEPGLPADGPITASLSAMSALDGAGNQVSPVGADVARLTDGRSVNVTFWDTGGAGVAPLPGRIILPEGYIGGGQAAPEFNVGLVAHELTHVLERDLGDPAYWPSGWNHSNALMFADGPEDLIYIVGESTNYMEVMSYIVGEAVEYDLLSQIPPAALTLREVDRLAAIEDNLATYTDPDSANAARYMLTTHPGAEVYRANYVHELGVSDGRIPAGGWDHWLKEMGFSEAATQRIQDIASRGTVQQIDPASLDPKTGLVVTPTPAPTTTPTVMPSPTTTQTPTPTVTATPSASSSPTPTPAAPATSTPGPGTTPPSQTPP